MLIGRGQWGAACAGALLIFSSTPARAQGGIPHETSPNSPGYATRPFHLELETGTASPVGVLGVRAEFSIGDPLALGAGIGTNGLGPEWELHARWRVVYGVNHKRHFYDAFTIEGAFTRSRFGGSPDISLDGGCGDCDEPKVVAQEQSFAQAELGWEGMSAARVTLRAALGAARRLGTAAWRCESGIRPVPCGATPGTLLPVIAFAAGYAF